MAIVIAVEDGTGVPNANSYGSVADARAYAEMRGIVLLGPTGAPATDDEVAAMIIKGMDYIEAQACKFQGSKTNCSQALQWPRKGVIICCEDYPSNQIPKELKNAVFAAVLVQNEGLVLQPNIQASDYVTEETVGPLTTKYADPIKTGITPTFTALDSIMGPLFFASCGQAGFAIRTIRV